MFKPTHRGFAAGASAIAALVAVVIATMSAAPALSDESKVVAKVDGAVITEKDVALAEAEIGQQLEALPAEARRRVLVEFLIENQLLAKEGQSQNLSATDAFTDRMEYWKRRSMREAYFEKLESEISEADLRKFYDENLKETGGGEEIRASHILVETEDKAKEIFEQIAHDGDFVELAKKNSIDPGSRAQGGDLGYFGRGMMVPAFEEAAFGLDVDQVSEPVKSQFGWHIIKVMDRRKKAAPPFEEVKERIRVALLRPRVKALLDQLRKDAELEYIDPEIRRQVEAESAAPRQ